MRDRDALMAAIVASPDDDLPRLAYADWLDENGEAERAEFIRLQIELARLPDGGERREALAEREKALLQRHQEAWHREFTAAGLSALEFRRGFVEEARLVDGERFLSHGDDLFHRTTLRELVYAWYGDPRNDDGELPPWLEALVQTSLARRITALHAEGNEPVWMLLDLLSCRSLEGLTTVFCLSRDDEGCFDAAVSLSEATHLTRLRHLTLWGVGQWLSAFASSPHLRTLEYLDVGDADNGLDGGVRAVDVTALAASPHLRGLRHLGLCGNWIEDRGAAALAASPLGALETLRVVHCGIEEAGLMALLSSSTLTGLRELAIDVQSMSMQTARAMVAAPLAKRLRRLSLHVWPEDEFDYTEVSGRETFESLFGTAVTQTIESGLGERVEFEVIDWSE